LDKKRGPVPPLPHIAAQPGFGEAFSGSTRSLYPMGKTIRQTVLFDSPPHEVFEALLDSKQHAAFTGDKAKINRRIGGTFSVFGGWAKGKTLRLEKDKIIVQSWRTVEFAVDDPDSQVMFHFSKKGKGTRLIFVHSKVPEDQVKAVRQGWKDFYWRPLKAYLG